MPKPSIQKEESILKRDFISSLAKGLDVLRAFDRNSPELTTADLAKKLSISRASARRFLLTLTGLGYLDKQGQRFHPTSKVLSLSSAFFSATPLSSVAQPFLEEVTRRTEESSSLGILENNTLIFLARSQSRWILNLGLRVGSALPAYCSAMGRILLSALSEEEFDHYLDTVELKAYNERTVTSKSELRKIMARARNQGYAMVDQELEQGLRAVAVPVLQNSEVIASISISTQANRATLRRMKEEFLPVLRDAADAISAEVSR